MSRIEMASGKVPRAPGSDPRRVAATVVVDPTRAQAGLGRKLGIAAAALALVGAALIGVSLVERERERPLAKVPLPPEAPSLAVEVPALEAGVPAATAAADTAVTPLPDPVSAPGSSATPTSSAKAGTRRTPSKRPATAPRDRGTRR